MTERAAKRPRCVTASELIEIYYHPAGAFGTITKCSVEDVPEPYRGLLAHTNHMTVTVESFHHDSVTVDVLRSSEDHEQYCREILLRTLSTSLVVQYGIVRLN